jgi:hypothetical protein
MIIWGTMPALGPIGALTAAFSNDPSIHEMIETVSPILLTGGGCISDLSLVFGTQKLRIVF